MKALIVALAAITLSTTACKKGGAAEGAEGGAASASAGWTAGQPVDAAVLEKLGGAVASCKLQSGSGFGLESSCPTLQTYQAASRTLPLLEQNKADAINAAKFLASAAPSVRALGVNSVGSIPGDAFADAMGKESDPAVLSYMVRSAGAAGAEKNPKVAAAVVAAAGNAAKYPRFHAAVMMGNPKIAGGTAKMMELAEKDPDTDVRQVACDGLGFHGEAALPLLEKLTKDTASPTYAKCFEGIVNAWAYYPRFDTNSEKAFKLTLMRLGQKPRAESAPPFGVFSGMTHLGDEKSSAAVAWHKTNAWFKPAVLVQALGDIVSDPTAGYLPKSSALAAAVANGATKKDLQAWRKAYGDKPEAKQNSIVASIDKAIAAAK